MCVLSLGKEGKKRAKQYQHPHTFVPQAPKCPADISKNIHFLGLTFPSTAGQLLQSGQREGVYVKLRPPSQAAAVEIHLRVVITQLYSVHPQNVLGIPCPIGEGVGERYDGCLFMNFPAPRVPCIKNGTDFAFQIKIKPACPQVTETIFSLSRDDKIVTVAVK